MKAANILLATAAALAAASVVSAKHHDSEDAGQAVDPSSISIEVDRLVDGRRAGYWMSAGLFGGMFGVINSGGEVKGLAMPARAIAGWAKALPGMFPEGSVNEKSNALPSVWSDREGFEATAQLYAERATKLAEIAESGDSEAFKAQWATVRQSCVACHEKYRRDRSKE